MKQSRNWWWLGLLVASSAMACGDEKPQEFEAYQTSIIDSPGVVTRAPDGYDPPSVDVEMPHQQTIFGLDQAARLFEGGVASLQGPAPFRQLSWMMDAHDVSALEYRAQRPDGTWTAWEDVHVYYSEGILHNARILLDFATSEVQLRGGESIVLATFEFYEEIVAPREIVHSRRGQQREDLREGRFAVAPPELVISRHHWQAIDPDKICGDVVAPYRMSIHHTASPSTDGPDAGARMRTMQSNHINGRGWCDIGYHFVVAQSGAIYQGRSRSDRPGAHVANHNAGNVGISFIANFEEQVPTQIQLESGKKMMRWVHDTHGVPLNREVVKGHQEWPGAATACPGRNLLTQLGKLVEEAGGDGTVVPPDPDPGVDYAVAIEANYLGLENFYLQGASAQIPDAMPGDTFQAEIRVTNNSNGPLRGVRLGYWFEEPFVVATNYVIQTDHPGRNQQTWQTNDADDAAENPAKAQMGPSGELTMYAFGAGETKRVLIDLQAERYSIGFVDHPALRGWVANIDGAYVQSDFDAAPTTNIVGGTLRAWAEADILSRDEWMFAGTHPQELEGWSGGGAYDALKIDAEGAESRLSINMTGSRATLISPAWTQVDADQYDALVFTGRSDVGPHVKAVYWRRDGESFTEDRVMRFKAAGDGTAHTYVVPLGTHGEWSGTVTGLRLHLSDGASPPLGLQELSKVYFQASGTTQTTSFTEGYADIAPVEVVGGALRAGPDLTRYVTAGQGSSLQEGLSVGSGCAAAGDSEAPGSAALLLAALMGFIALRRRN